MPVRDFPPRPQGAEPDSVPMQNWLDTLGNRQSIDMQQELTSVDSADELLIFDVSETGQVKTKKATVASIGAAIGGGDVVGPTSSTDHAAARFDLATGKLLQDSALIVADTTGALSRSGGGGIPVQGVNTNSNAAAGDVGEILSTVVLVGSGVALTTDTQANAGSLSLTAGDWDISAELWFLAGSGATCNYLDGWINTTSATAPSVPSLGAGRHQFFIGSGVSVSNTTLVIGITNVRASLAGTTTYYFGAKAGFTVGMTLFGKIVARRAR